MPLILGLGTPGGLQDRPEDLPSQWRDRDERVIALLRRIQREINIEPNSAFFAGSRSPATAAVLASTGC